MMTPDRVHWYLDLFESLGLSVWLDGGWGVDALLGRQTRPHRDLDILIPTDDAVRLVAALRAHGFEDIPTDDRSDRNFVMGHPDRGEIDFHVFHLQPDGSAVYGPGDIDFVITTEELSARGTVSGRECRCLTPEYQMRSHTGYPLAESDIADVRALGEHFGLPLLPAHKDWIEENER